MKWLRFALYGFLISCAPAAQSQLMYNVADLGTLGGTTGVGNAVNNNGEVVGTSYLLGDQVQNAFVSGKGGSLPLRDLGTLGGSQSFGLSINANALIAGTSQITGDGAYHAFVVANDGSALINLGTLGGANSYGNGVNGSGQVAGYSNTAGGTTHAFLSRSNGGGLIDLQTLPGGTSSFANAVNASGQVAGYSGTASGVNHAFISATNGGTLRDLGTIGGMSSFGTAINDAGQVVGRSATSTIGQHAFRSGPNGGALADLGTLGGFSSFGEAINSLGAVTGYSYLSDNSTQHAFIYTTARGMQDLNGLLVAGSGFVLTDARAINDRGQITGMGTIGGEVHAFLLTPVAINARITSIARMQNGHVVVLGVGTPFQNYTVQATTDLLVGFSSLSTVTAASDGSLQFEDVDAASFPRRFYRFAYF